MSDIADYSVQPPPRDVEGAVSVHDLVVQDMLALFPPDDLRDLGVESVLDRKEFGLGKYGVVLHADNGRNYFLDVDDEAGDLPVYIRALMEARPDLAERLREDYVASLGIMLRMRAMLVEHGSVRAT